MGTDEGAVVGAGELTLLGVISGAAFCLAISTGPVDAAEAGAAGCDVGILLGVTSG